jgi:hypothetical protein
MKTKLALSEDFPRSLGIGRGLRTIFHYGDFIRL